MKSAVINSSLILNFNYGLAIHFVKIENLGRSKVNNLKFKKALKLILKIKLAIT